MNQKNLHRKIIGTISFGNVENLHSIGKLKQFEIRKILEIFKTHFQLKVWRIS